MPDASETTADQPAPFADAVRAEVAAAERERIRREVARAEAQLDALAAVPTATLIESGRATPGEVRIDRRLADALAAQVDRINAEAAAVSGTDETGAPGRFITTTEDGFRPLGEPSGDYAAAQDLADLRSPEPPGCPGCAFCTPAQEATRTPLPLVEDQDGAPYPGHVQDALAACRAAVAPHMTWHAGEYPQETADDVLAALAPVLLDLLPDPDSVATARALTAEAAALRDRADALADRLDTLEDQVRAECYAGAADDPGNLDVTPTDAQWLRRLFDLPADQRLASASYLAAAGQTARTCFEGNHVRRLTALEDQAHRLGRVRDVLARFGEVTDPDGPALVAALDVAVHGPSPIDSTPLACPERHPDTGNPCTVTGPHGDAEHRAMGRVRVQLFGSALTEAQAPADPLLCPECAQGKAVCAGQALDPETDDLVPCATTQGSDQ